MESSGGVGGESAEFSEERPPPVKVELEEEEGGAVGQPLVSALSADLGLVKAEPEEEPWVPVGLEDFFREAEAEREGTVTGALEDGGVEQRAAKTTRPQPCPPWATAWRQAAEDSSEPETPPSPTPPLQAHSLKRPHSTEASPTSAAAKFEKRAAKRAEKRAAKKAEKRAGPSFRLSLPAKKKDWREMRELLSGLGSPVSIRRLDSMAGRTGCRTVRCRLSYKSWSEAEAGLRALMARPTVEAEKYYQLRPKPNWVNARPLPMSEGQEPTAAFLRLLQEHHDGWQAPRAKTQHHDGWHCLRAHNNTRFC